MSPHDSEATQLPLWLLTTPIEHLALCKRTERILKHQHCETIGEVLALDSEQLLYLTDFGCLSEVAAALKRLLGQSHTDRLAGAKIGDLLIKTSTSFTPGNSWVAPQTIKGSLDAPVTVLHLPLGSAKVLEKLKIGRVGQVLNYPKVDLVNSTTCSEKSLREIERQLFCYLTFGDSFIGKETMGAVERLFPGGKNASARWRHESWALPEDIRGDLRASVDSLDLSVRATGVLKRLRIETVGELVELGKSEFSKAKNCGKKTMGEVGTKLLLYLSTGRPLGTEFVGLVAFGAEPSMPGTKASVNKLISALPERSQSLISARYGFWDGIAETLQDIGDKLGLTRERIRQIEHASLTRLTRALMGIGEDFVRSKISNFLAENKELCGILGERDMIMCFADDCTLEEAELALVFFKDLEGASRAFFSQHVAELEKGVYCLERGRVSEYRTALDLLDKVLEAQQRPLPKDQLVRAVSTGLAAAGVSSSGVMSRVLDLSPSFTRLRSGDFVLSSWPAFGRANSASLAEDALRSLSRSAHFSEIKARISELYPDLRCPDERTIHNALVVNRDKFAWVKSGTYGLKAWGLKPAPYIKDRLIEVLLEARSPRPYSHLKQKVLEVCNCKEQSVRMTLDMNPRLFKKCDDDQYDLVVNPGL